MKITDRKYYNSYYNLICSEIDLLLGNYDFSDEKVDLNYLTKASAVFSSNIEGNSIDLNSFMNYKLSNERFSPTKEIQEIEDLISAYSSIYGWKWSCGTSA